MSSKPNEDSANGERPPPSSRASRPSGVEHRAFARAKIEVEVGLSSESQFFAGLTSDISQGGLFVSTYRVLAVGSKVDIALTLAEIPLNVHGTVRWTREASGDTPPGFGVSFEGLSESDKKTIERFCSARAPLYYDVDDAL
jgi:uncharacterized protein (TIGR02266 family)